MAFPEPGLILEKNFNPRRRNGERPGKFPAANQLPSYFRLGFDDSDDLVRTRIDDHDFLADQNVIVTTPLWIYHDDLLR